jgi:poly(3-hydroxybutyrate) depolymerase
VFQDFAPRQRHLERARAAGAPAGHHASVALLTIEGELDDISGSRPDQAAHDLCKGIPKSPKQHYDAEGAGHYGIFSGRRWRETDRPADRELHPRTRLRRASRTRR